MRRLLPAAVEVAEEVGDLHDTGDTGDTGPYPDERAAVAGATPARQREHAAVRALARRAMRGLGVPAGPVLLGPDRAPVWPPGVVGSLTHCAGYRAAALARAGSVRAVGIDAEPHAPLPDGVAAVVLRADERPGAGPAGVHADRVLFSAKEAVYKAWYPSARRRIDFGQVRVTLLSGGVFEVAVDADAGGPVVTSGRWQVDRGLVLTAVVLPA